MTEMNLTPVECSVDIYIHHPATFWYNNERSTGVQSAGDAQFTASTSKTWLRARRFAAFHSGVLIFIPPDRVSD